MCASKNRSKGLQILLPVDERQAIDELAELYGLNASELVRHAVNYIRVIRPMITVYPPLATKNGQDGDEQRWLRVRMDERERNSVDALADEYGLDNTKFMRLVIAYLRHAKPNPLIIPDTAGRVGHSISGDIDND